MIKKTMSLLIATCTLISIILILAPPVFSDAQFNDTLITSQVNSNNTKINCVMSFTLPRPLVKTDFTSPITVNMESNGSLNNYQFKGVPFLYENTTYIPARDISEAFGITVQYNLQDRAVKLSRDGLALIIMPTLDAYRNEGRSIELPSNKINDVGYLLINNVSYVPLRTILEYFSFDVNYSNQVITISGNMSNLRNSDNFFDYPYHDLVTKAFSNYEGASKISFKGLYSNGEQIDATLNKTLTANKISYKYNIKANGQNYIAEAYKDSSNQSFYSSNAYVDMSELHTGGHPYAYIGIISDSHFGILKYAKQKHTLTFSDEKTLRYEIAVTEYGTETIEISKETGKIVKFIRVLPDGKAVKNLTISY